VSERSRSRRVERDEMGRGESGIWGFHQPIAPVRIWVIRAGTGTGLDDESVPHFLNFLISRCARPPLSPEKRWSVSRVVPRATRP
jgi:hypothetical protein